MMSEKANVWRPYRVTIGGFTLHWCCLGCSGMAPTEDAIEHDEGCSYLNEDRDPLSKQAEKGG